jgi:hypothetical protein
VTGVGSPPAQSTERTQCIRLFMLTLAALAALASPAAGSTHHRHGCRSAKCDRHAEPRAGYHKPMFVLAPFERCVANGESAFDRFAHNGVDQSYYQWLPATWRAAQHLAGVWYSSSPFLATLEQQTRVFRSYEPRHRLAWPRTVPLCGG